MNITESPKAQALRAEMHAWIATEVPQRFKNLPLGVPNRPEIGNEALAPFFALLEKKNWLFPAWPKEHGGAGFDIEQMIVFGEEWLKAGLPEIRNAALDHFTPILMRYGTEAQKQRFLGPTLRREILWAQGYSEPNAGSDLASLATRADKVEGGWRLNGQKIWTSGAHHAHWFYVLARTDPSAKRKQDGISFLLVDRKSPGLTIRPIKTIDDFSHFNETFFENVFVPEDMVVGQLHKGWTVAKVLLGYERFAAPAVIPVLQYRVLEELKSDARRLADGKGGALWDDPGLKRQVAGLEMEIDCNQATRLRALDRVARGEHPGPETMFFKFWGVELMQRIMELHQLVHGPQGIAWSPSSPFGRPVFDMARRATTVRSSTIAGGTSEVARNVLAKRVLELPER
ncbi:MAG: acyl-CoA dehydrogenase family protein [Candidatus Lambdaproteobacteria bacterium]|nr:acyl-CoA dehydrogenase family protein [Candidatus Lambdaproteobacteria bacterium]